jgi:ABC-type glutathione transport system ATPase component
MTTTVQGADFGPLIRVEDLSVVFPTRGTAAQALDTVSIEIARRERIGIVGESGSGKSTLALAMAGHIARPLNSRASARTGWASSSKTPSARSTRPGASAGNSSRTAARFPLPA